MKKALVILFDKTEEIEAVAPIDILRRSNVGVTTAALGNSLKITGRSGISIEADKLFDEIFDENFDAVILPGGPGVRDIAGNANSQANSLKLLLQRHASMDKITAAICAAPAVFAEIGLLNGKNWTSHHSVSETIGGKRSPEGTVRDGNIITSRGAGTAVEFGLKILEALGEKGQSDEIAKSICFNE